MASCSTVYLRVLLFNISKDGLIGISVYKLYVTCLLLKYHQFRTRIYRITFGFNLKKKKKKASVTMLAKILLQEPQRLFGMTKTLKKILVTEEPDEVIFHMSSSFSLSFKEPFA